MTFKDLIINKAAEEESNIQKYVDDIKTNIERFATKHHYTIRLIKPASGRTLTMGGGNTNSIDLFIPSTQTPEDYRQLFVNAFKQLGFTDEDIKFNESETEYYNSYDIILYW